MTMEVGLTNKFGTVKSLKDFKEDTIVLFIRRIRALGASKNQKYNYYGGHYRACCGRSGMIGQI
ncbi:hypothetical protein GCM10028791_38260 [Echinicola sediminis]